ncbi:sulfite exporter TauE/SafE family protein [Lacticaseibacillus baoqingensis]|uniref:Probable membrane transporter protein n=1 Tax=Lacticaseibacillus baoqingensis TaxID=2486013 RepID=A0ABW4E7A6_9LACO|nr:TSUP family transporter [Lacticaseibacillus baoqingensis]
MSSKEDVVMTWLTFMIVCPLVGLAGFVDAIAGGGGLISLPAYLMTGIPAHMAIGTNKLSSGMGTLVATAEFARSGYIRIKLAIVAVVMAMLGANIGSNLALHLSDHFFRLLLLAILPLTALYLLLHRTALTAPSAVALPPLKAGLAVGAIALLLGAYDGFYGPGAGTFLLLALTGIARLPLNTAAGTTKVINLTTNLTSLVVFLCNGKVYLLLGLSAGCFSILGNHLGTRYFKRFGGRGARPLILLVLTIFFAKTVWDFCH